MELACRRCGTVLEGPSGQRIVCATCGNVTVMPSSAPAPTRRATAPGTFTPPPEPAHLLSAPGSSVSYTGPKTYSMPAILSLIFGILPFVLAGPLYLAGMGAAPDGPGGFFGVLSAGLGIAAIVLGFVGLRQVNREPQRYKGRGMAIAGLTLGIVFTALWVIAVIVVIVFLIMYLSAYGNSTAMMAPCPAVALQSAMTDPRLKRNARLRMLFAHHPECAAFHRDVITTGGMRLCASCTAFLTTATATGYVLLLLGPSSAVAPMLILGGGLLILLPQLLSVLRWTRSRVRKMLVKAVIGVGAATMLAGLLTAAWPSPVRLAVFAAVTLAATLLVLPRRRRLYEEMAAHTHDASCGATPSA